MSKDEMNDTTITREEEITAELLVDTEHVCVPLERFEQLITAETMLAVVQRACRTLASYQLTDILKLLFPNDMKGEDDA